MKKAERPAMNEMYFSPSERIRGFKDRYIHVDAVEDFVVLIKSTTEWKSAKKAANPLKVPEVAFERTQSHTMKPCTTYIP